MTKPEVENFLALEGIGACIVEGPTISAVAAELREMGEEIARLRIGESEELWNACAKLRDRLDIDKNPAMMGSAIETVLVAIDEIDHLKAELQAKAGRVKLLAEMLDRHHICGYNTGNAAEPCLVCYAIHDAQDKERE